jgi:hypothetical protein
MRHKGKGPHRHDLDGGGMDGVDGGVSGVDSEVWTALGHAQLSGDLRRMTAER